jgi:uncharacterized protein (DUF1330 family)
MRDSKKSNSKREFMSTAGVAASAAAISGLVGSKNVVNAQDLGINAMGPTPEQAQAFAQLPDRPVVMVNLLKFKSGTGASEYGQYAEDVGKILADIGAEIIFRGACQGTLIGGAEWDSVILVRYPNSRALLQMSQSAEYQAISSNRTSGLEGQMNLAVFE